jgi:hypothetical protein
MKHKGVLVTTNGEIALLEVDAPLYQSISKTIGGFEMVYPKGLTKHEIKSGNLVFVCHDMGLLVDLPINVLASWLYWDNKRCNGGSPIAGDIIIMKCDYTDEGPDLVGLTDADVEVVKTIINGLVKGWELKEVTVNEKV